MCVCVCVCVFGDDYGLSRVIQFYKNMPALG